MKNFLETHNLSSLCLGVLLFIWTLPDTIALRNILIAYFSIITIIKLIKKNIKQNKDDFFILTLIIYISLFNISEENLKNIGTILRLFGAYLIGIYFASVKLNYKIVINFCVATFILLSSIVLLTKYNYISIYIEKSNTLLIGFILIVLLSRMNENKRIFYLINTLLIIFYALIIKSRYGILMILTYLLTNKLIFQKRENSNKTLFRNIKLIILFIGSLFLLDSKWFDLHKDITIIYENINTIHWMSPDIFGYPTDSNGNIPNMNVYERFTWFIKGIFYIIENPFGTGLMSGSFKYYILKEYLEIPIERIPNGTHSTIIDLVMSFGIFFPILILFHIMSVIKRDNNKKLYENLPIYIIFIFVLIFSENNSKHALEIYVFIYTYLIKYNAK